MRITLWLIGLLLVAALSGWALWFFVANIDPVAMDLMMWLAVYGLVFTVSGCVFLFLNLLGRRTFSGRLKPVEYKAGLRQSAILAAALAGFLALQQVRQLTILSGGVILVLALGLEALAHRQTAQHE